MAKVPPGLKQQIKETEIMIQKLMDNWRAQYADAPGTSIPSRRAYEEIIRKQEELEALKQQLNMLPTEPAWGPTPGAMRVQDIMDRYGDVKQGMGSTPEQMELRLGTSPDYPGSKEHQELIRKSGIEDVPLAPERRREQIGYGVPPRSSQQEYEAWYKSKAAQRQHEALKKREEMIELYGPDFERKMHYDWD